MGSLFSKTDDNKIESLINKINELELYAEYNIENRLKELESHADLDGDGIVTREEMETYMATKLQLREAELIELRDALEKEKSEHIHIREKYEELRELYTSDNPEKVSVSRISGKVIKRFIEEQLEDPDHNWKNVPDIVEKPVKLAEYKASLELIEHLFSMGYFDIAGHRIQGTIKPISEK